MAWKLMLLVKFYQIFQKKSYTTDILFFQVDISSSETAMLASHSTLERRSLFYNSFFISENEVKTLEKMQIEFNHLSLDPLNLEATI